MKAIILSGMLAAASLAQNSSVSGPVSGMIFDERARAMRPVMGVPGAAYLGAPAISGLDFGAMSPDGLSAVASRAGRIYLVRFGAGEPAWQDLAAGAIERAVWSADSRFAAVSSGRTVGLVKAGDAAWETLGEAEDEILSLEVVTGGAVAGVRGSGVTRFRQGDRRLLAPVAEPSGLAAQGSDLYVTDRSRGDLLVIRNFLDEPEVGLVASEALAVSDPVGVAISADGRRLLVVGGSSRRLATFDRATGTLESASELDFEPVRMERFSMGALGRSGLFALNRPAGTGSLEILDSGQLTVFFVPSSDATAEVEE